MKKIIYSLAVASLLLVSCKKDAATEETVAETTTDTTAVAVDATATTTPAITPVAPNAMGTNPNTIMNQGSNSTIQQTTNVQMPQPVKVAAGMNPSHGQPGHRCDIAVGAPLNSPVGKAAVTQQPSQPAVINSQQFNTDGKSTITTTPSPTNAPPVVTAAGMNPPHGQDGHRCDVAVGAPLPKA